MGTVFQGKNWVPCGTSCHNPDFQSCAEGTIYSRPATNAVFINTGRLFGQENELTIDNTQGTLDAVAILTTVGNSRPEYAVYIREGAKITISKIRSGTYDLYFTLGENWNPKEQEFATMRTFRRFEDPFTFTETLTTYSTWRVTLYGVVSGNANTPWVPEEQFPQL